MDKIADQITFINKGKLFYTGEKVNFTRRYSIVSGSVKQLSPDIKALTPNIKIYPDSFEALVETEYLPGLSGLQTRSAAMDDIIVFISKGEVSP